MSAWVFHPENRTNAALGMARVPSKKLLTSPKVKPVEQSAIMQHFSPRVLALCAVLGVFLLE